MKKNVILVAFSAFVACGVVFSASLGWSSNEQSDLTLKNIQALSQLECSLAYSHCGVECDGEFCGYCKYGEEYHYMRDYCIVW